VPIQTADRLQSIQPSATLAITALAAELKRAGRDVIGLGAGEPDFDTPEPIKQSAIAAINAGYTKYTPVDGLPELKDAVARKFERDNGLSYDAGQILISAGGKQSFYNLCQALLNPGDEVIIPAPYWVSYPDMVRLAGGVPVFPEATLDQGFVLDAEQLAATLSPRTRMIVINSPGNPTGAVYKPSDLAALGEVLRRWPQVVIASDDMYEHVYWSDESFHNLFNVCPDLTARGVVLNGVSKAYAMTGWRIGYAAGPSELIQAMKTVQSQSTSCPAAVSQRAAYAALTGDQGEVQRMCAVFRNRHGVAYETLQALSGVVCRPSDGTFYIFPSFRGFLNEIERWKDDVAFARALLDEVGVAVVPGSAFGAPGHIRLSFALDTDSLQEALARIRRFVEDHLRRG